MRVSTKHDTSLALPAELSRASAEVYERHLKDVLDDHPAGISLDCSRASLIASGHIQLLWIAKERCEDAGASLILRTPSAGLLRILALLDLSDQFVTEGNPTSFADPYLLSHATKVDARYEDHFQATLDAVTAATHRFKDFLATLPIDELIQFEMMTIFYEVANNTREHGAIPERSPIHFDSQIASGRSVMRFSDSGKPYNPCTADAVREENRMVARRSRGYGLPLIRRMVSGMTYVRTPEGENVLTLDKRWEGRR